MKALIRAQTIGSRLAPLTNLIPKPVIPVLNRPSMEHAMRLLAKYGVRDFVVTLHDRANYVKKLAEESARLLSCEVTFVRCPTQFKGMPWLKDYFDEAFFALDCDILTNVDLAALYRFHKDHIAMTTYALIKPQAPKLPSTTTDNNGQLIRIDRKHQDEDYFHIIGVTVHEKEIFDYYEQSFNIHDPFVFDDYPPWLNLHPFSNEFFDSAPYLKFAENSRWFGFKSNAYGLDIGKPYRYLKAHKDFFMGYGDLGNLQLYEEIDTHVWVAKRVNIDPSAEITGPVIIGDRSTIECGARILPYSFIGENVFIGDKARINQTIIWPDSSIGSDTLILNSIIPNECIIGSQSRIDNVVLIAPGQTIPSKTILCNALEL